ncbi:serine--tRNA ligase, partial [Sulfitobacter sp. UBA4523]|uniref:serine--tRNA ligase n=1 Tax=Sulfitobacter sp. UBA4523 TaxID=1947584 RepID=UPI00257CEA85
MHDIKAIRENPDAFDAALARRGDTPVSAQVLALDEARRAKISAAETAQAEQNKASKLVGAAKAKGDEAEFERLRTLVSDKKAEVTAMQAEAKDLDAQLTDMLARIPNLPADDAPDGADEADNVEVNRWGDVPAFDFKAKEHFEIASVAASMDFETAAKTSGARFVMLKGAVARIHRALAQFMIDTHVDENGLTEHMTPVLVRDEAMYGTDKLPKFGDDSYQTTNGWWLIPTSEVTLTYSVAGDVLEEAALPRRMTAHTLCFRSEAGSAGRDTSGMLRQHQFEKVEMVSICRPEDSDAEHERMTKCAEGILE